ncbi:mycothiol synthase [Mycetocola spongiae]|uniref:mycothiol synthase n=1 Tax=Mycetocola spongiae TaxID=2859226 RepID=UPI001CF40DCC|nr:mycothiol synthase [Mycetocola spongiae]UCR88765.1 mycothiol synthase [Mycetocola spongiae]
MSSPRIRPAADLSELEDLAGRAAAVDGQRAFNDQALFAARAGSRTATVLDWDGEILGAALTGEGELEAVIDPEYRRRGLGETLLNAVLQPQIHAAWAHGDHEGARALALKHGFRRDRVLFQLSAPLSGEAAPAESFSTFIPGRDEEAWVALNARVFADHPEQGKITVADVLAREAEPWFSAENFLLAREGNNILAYLWLKVEPGASDGEIYVIGVNPENAGQGLGRRLMNAGLARLRALGLSTASLYVDESNSGAVALYRSLGFIEATVDVQYRRI